MESRFINWHQLAYGCLPILSLCSQVAPAHAQEQSTSAVTITASELFAFADRARDAGDFVAAETAYRALTNDPELELRVEARFRLGMMFADQMQKYREAAIEFRRILDEKPKATRVRLELAPDAGYVGQFGIS